MMQSVPTPTGNEISFVVFLVCVVLIFRDFEKKKKKHCLIDFHASMIVFYSGGQLDGPLRINGRKFVCNSSDISDCTEAYVSFVAFWCQFFLPFFENTFFVVIVV